jgi:hypothetical protein
MNDAISKRANLILQAVGKQLNTWTGSYRIILDTEKEILEALEHDQTTDISTELRQKLNDYLVSLGQLAGLTLTIGLAVIDCAVSLLFVLLFK